MIFPSSVPFVLSVMHREGNCCFSVYLFHIVKSIKYIHIYINIYIYIYIALILLAAVVLTIHEKSDLRYSCIIQIHITEMYRYIFSI